jgi:protein-tyrosine phosphatase
MSGLPRTSALASGRPSPLSSFPNSFGRGPREGIAWMRKESTHNKAWRARRALMALMALTGLMALTVLLVGGCVYMSPHTLKGSCPTALDSPVRNFCVVTPHVLWRGEHPTAADASWLVQQRVGSVLSLQVDARRAFEHATVTAADAPLSVPYYRMRGLDPLQMLSSRHLDDRAAMFLAIVSTAPRPVYVHCRAGIDRVGVLLAVYRMLVEDVSADDAIAEMARFQSPWLPLEKRYIRELSETRREQIRRDAARLKSIVQPQGHFECRDGRCSYSPAPAVAGAG